MKHVHWRRAIFSILLVLGLMPTLAYASVDIPVYTSNKNECQKFVSNSAASVSSVPTTGQTMNDAMANMDSATNWLIAIDYENCLLRVYTRDNAHSPWEIQYTWVCSPGAWETPTVRGVFQVQEKGYEFGDGFSCYYWTQFYGNYLIHSSSYYDNTFEPLDDRMGVHISAGCVRLEIQNAKYIYDNVPRGTTVYVY